MAKQRQLIIFILISFAIDRHQSKECISMEDFESSIEKTWSDYPGMDQLLATSTFLGEGSYGKVSSLFWKPLNKEVAVKKLTFDKKKWKKEIAEIEKEVSISHSLNQLGNNRKRKNKKTLTPAPEVYYCVMDETPRAKSYAYVIMELMSTSLELSCLNKKNEDCPIRYWAEKEEDDRLGSFIQIAKSIQLMHEKDFVHDDLKPDNIAAFDEDISKFKLIDFGMSGERESKAKGGTLFYMDELRTKWFLGEQTQAQSKKMKTDVRTTTTDIYSFGITMAEMLFSVGAYLDGQSNLDLFKGLVQEVNDNKYDSRATTKVVSERVFKPSKLKTMRAFTCVIRTDLSTPICVYHAIFGALI